MAPAVTYFCHHQYATFSSQERHLMNVGTHAPKDTQIHKVWKRGVGGERKTLNGTPQEPGLTQVLVRVEAKGDGS